MRLLLVEDKDSFRRLLVHALEGSVWETTAAADPTEALAHLELASYDVLVTDLRLPSYSGVELLRKVKRIRPGIRAVVMSAYAEPRDIVEAMRAGADDFLPKPFDLELFLALLDRLRALVGAPPPDPRELWVARAPAMMELEQQLKRIADTTVPVLFLGESGAGKGRAARRLHVLGSGSAPFATRAAGAFLSKGPDTDLLRLLKGGTLYLSGLEEVRPGGADGLAKLMGSPAGQALRWMAGADELREIPEPLGIAFGALQLRVPPLRERPEDILPLFRGYLGLAAQAEGRTPPDLDKAIERQVLEQSWPGNVRDLAASARATLRSAERLTVRRLVLEERRARLSLAWPDAGPLDGMLKELAREAECALLQRALEAAGGETHLAAQSLGISVRALGLRLREHGIAVKD